MNPGRALWYALKVEDYDLVEQLINEQTDVKQTYELSTKKFYSTTSLLVLRVCQARQKGLNSILYKRLLNLIHVLLQYIDPSEIRCHCSKNYEHRCPLYIIMKQFGITKEEEFMEKKNDLIKLLILKGATLRQLEGQKVIDLEGYRQYVLQKAIQSTKGFQETQYK
ncbi:hypothetical protein pb186bvf_004592 [Paramecium bursaria]